MARPEPKIAFTCPLCNCEKFVRVKVQRPSGAWYTTPFYECFGCSAMFLNPVKFSGNLVAGDDADRSPRSFER